MAASSVFDSPNLTLALALASGIVAQTVASHLRVPGIVLLLATGVVLGPDILDVVRPVTLGDGLGGLVGFAVAIILFEGGMNLHMPALRRAGTAIQRLITVGAVVTAIGASLAAHYVMGWDWGLSILFGTLLTVTGPTVVTPLLRRLRVEHSTATVLEAEGVLIDPIGAIGAYVVYETILHPGTSSVLTSLPDVLMRLGVGASFGALGGWVLSRALRVRGLVPEGLTNVFTLSSVLALFHVSEAILHESGIAAVTIMGMAVRFLGTPVERELLEFKEQLTVLLIGLLFVLLAADVRLADVQALGWEGLAVVGLLMFVVRPLNVLASTIGTTTDWRQRAFLAWIAPRGIVAAAVASLFAGGLADKGVPNAGDLRSLVFLVIAVTVVTAGLTGGLVAQLLGLRRPSDQGWLLLGAHGLARKLAEVLAASGEEVLLIDTNPDACLKAEDAGLRVMHANALKESTLARAEIDIRRGAIGLSANEEVNYLFLQAVRAEARLTHLYAALGDPRSGVTEEMLHRIEATSLFAGVDVERWDRRCDEDGVRLLRARVTSDEAPSLAALHGNGYALPIALWRGSVLLPVGDDVRLRRRDDIVLLVDRHHEDDVLGQLRGAGLSWRETVELTEDAPRDDVTA